MGFEAKLISIQNTSHPQVILRFPHRNASHRLRIRDINFNDHHLVWDLISYIFGFKKHL
jgi:hypothetical protein